MTVAGCFSGIGGFTLAFHRAGFTPLWECEIDQDARDVLQGHFPDVTIYEDIRNVSRPARPDVLVGGFPCQDLSVAGKRAGLKGKRSGLYWELLRLVDETQPGFTVFENVPGLLSSEGGRDMGAVLGGLAELGYGWAYRVLDAQYAGVPQRRRRVFIVGCAGGDWKRAASVLFESHSLQRHPAPRKETGEGVAGTLGGGSGSRGWAPDTERMTFVPILEAGKRCGTKQDKRDGLGIGKDGDPMFTLQSGAQHAVAMSFDPVNVTSKANRTRVEPGLPCNTLHSAGMAVAFETRFARNGRGAPGEVVPPLKAQSGGTGKGDGAPCVAAQMAVRRLLPVECERLQGFPDNWTKTGASGKEMPDSARYRMCGNAVATPVVEWIARRIAEAIAP